ncbi:MAG: hypothetical protein AB2806_21475 [Candidatus Thiodiazotropha sp.]
MDQKVDLLYESNDENGLDQGTPVVSSYNEWDLLEEVIVGSVKGAAKMAFEPSIGAFFDLHDEYRSFKGGCYTEKEIEDAELQLNTLANILEKEGIVVRRPDDNDYKQPISTPDFKIPYGHCHACPRDVLLVVGDEIIEAPMAQRARFFEYRVYRNLLKEYFNEGAKWSTAPKPLMNDLLYNQDYTTEYQPFDADKHHSLTEYEPCFDAASFVRFGKDIFYQPDTVTNDFGARWLQRHLGNTYRIHRISFSDRKPPQHLDTTLVPVSSKIILINPERPCADNSLDIFTKNRWELVPAASSVRDVDHSFEVSNWISMNTLCIDENKVIVEEAEEPMIKLLESLGCEVITCKFDAVYKFGGSFHCCTVDIRRRGSLKSYFPSLDS